MAEPILPDDFDPSWIVGKVREHDHRLNSHSEMLIAHDAEHDAFRDTHAELRSGVHILQSQLLQQRQLHDIEVTVIRQTYKEIRASQESAADRSVKQHHAMMEALRKHGAKDEFWYGVQIVMWGVFGLCYAYWAFTR